MVTSLVQYNLETRDENWEDGSDNSVKYFSGFDLFLLFFFLIHIKSMDFLFRHQCRVVILTLVCRGFFKTHTYSGSWRTSKWRHGGILVSKSLIEPFGLLNLEFYHSLIPLNPSSLEARNSFLIDHEMLLLTRRCSFDGRKWCEGKVYNWWRHNAEHSCLLFPYISRSACSLGRSATYKRILGWLLQGLGA